MEFLPKFNSLEGVGVITENNNEIISLLLQDMQKCQNHCQVYFAIKLVPLPVDSVYS